MSPWVDEVSIVEMGKEEGKGRRGKEGQRAKRTHHEGHEGARR
jgi:hypothetical protein